jgi:hypothetical protein
LRPDAVAEILASGNIAEDYIFLGGTRIAAPHSQLDVAAKPLRLDTSLATT